MSSETTFLSAYDSVRTPHTTITDDILVSLPLKALDTEIVCPICLSACRNTMTTMECLHRFCADCISKSLRYSNKECPTCRQPLATMRSLRPDPEFDAIVSHIYPDLETYDESQSEMLERMLKYTNRKAYADSVQEGMRKQAMLRRGGTAASSVGSKRGSKKYSELGDSIQSRITNHSTAVELAPAVTTDLPKIKLNCILVPSECAVVHVAQYIADRVAETAVGNPRSTNVRDGGGRNAVIGVDVSDIVLQCHRHALDPAVLIKDALISERNRVGDAVDTLLISYSRRDGRDMDP